jgi:hypothetical protein
MNKIAVKKPTKDKNRHRGSTQRIISFIIFGFVLGALSISMVFSQEHEPIKHEVSVSRSLIPFYAYDSGGNPVYDLKMEELQLYINGKRMEITDFNRIVFEYDWETMQKVKVTERKIKPTSPVQERVVFLVVDTMFNSFYGIKRAKEICNKLIDSDSFSFASQFVIMENSLFGGLKLIGGPENDKKRLKKFLKKISRIPVDSPEEGGEDVSSRNFEGFGSSRRRRVERKMERWNKKEKVKFFCGFLSQLKYSLQAITQPKLVFLVSEGIDEILFYDSNPYMKEHIVADSSMIDQVKKLVKEINEGGGLMYAIYSGRPKIYKKVSGISPGESGSSGLATGEDDDFTLDSINFLPFVRESGVSSLKDIALGTGARFYDDVSERMVKEIHNSTAAYYELAFVPKVDPGTDMHIKIKCKRKGVRIDSILQAKSSIDYIDMNKIQKKVFAINVALGRSWAHTTEKTRKALFWGKDNQVQVKMPEEMNGRRVDVFLIWFDKDLTNPHLTMKSSIGADIETIEIEPKESDRNKSLYFVIVESESGQCVYNQVNR